MMYTHGIVNNGTIGTTTLNVKDKTTTNGINNNGLITTDDLNAEYISAYEVDISYVYAEGVYADYVSAHEVDANHVFTDTLTVYDDVTIGGHTTPTASTTAATGLPVLPTALSLATPSTNGSSIRRSIRSTAASTT